MNCTSCGITLEPDDACPQTEYQFQNALWIGFHGGYGMFVDNLNATLPNNTEDRWLRDSNGEYIVRPADDFGGMPEPVENKAWVPTYNEERILEQPDYEAVLCHECAHDLCFQVDWLARLLNPHGSHAHKTAWKEAHPEHFGWDYEDHGYA